MSGHCFDCGSTNKDEQLNLIKQQAKKQAIDNGEAMAIYQEGGTWYIITAALAIAGSYPNPQFVSPYN